MSTPTKIQIQLAINLEEKIDEGSQDYNDITQLTLVYRQFIEYYDLINNPMKEYFIEKMKKLMHSPTTIQQLIVSAPQTRRNSPQEHQKHYYQNYQYETFKNQTITPRGIKQLQDDFLHQKENIEKIINNDYEKQLQLITEKLRIRQEKRCVKKQKSPKRTFTKIYKPPTLDLLE